MQFTRLDHASKQESERIRTLLFDSYSVEADVIGVTDFPPLKRSAEDIRSAHSSFFGCVHNGVLSGVAEIESDDLEPTNIASFAVHPDVLRCGIGTFLLIGILEFIGNHPITVSTASVNTPAISLYEKHGFQIIKDWATPCRISMVTMALSR